MQRRTGMILAQGALAAALAGPAAVRAAPEPSGPRPSGVQETVQVVLVQLPLIATDRQGRPVTDLSAAEIVIEEGGQRLPVTYLDRLHRPASANEELPPVRLYVDAPGGWGLPETSTPGQPDYVVFFIDAKNDDPMLRDKTTERLIEFAKNELEPWVRAAVASFDGTLSLKLAFTTDREALATALAEARAAFGGPLTTVDSKTRELLSRFDDCVLPGQTSLTATADEQCLHDVAREYAEQERPNVEAYLDALTDTVRFLIGLRGRKTVYALSHGVAVDPMPVITEAARSVLGNASQVANLQIYLGSGDRPEVKMNRLLELAVRSRVSLNFIDRMRVPTSDGGARTGRLMYPGSFPAKVAYTAAQDDLKEMAGTTGGVFRAATDVTSGLRQVHELQEAAYELGYTLDRLPSRSRLEKIKVSTTRRGVRLTYNRGAYLETVAERPGPLQGRIALGSPSRHPAEDAVGARYDFVLQADPKQLGYTPEGKEEMSATFTLDFVVEDDQGRGRVDSYHLIQHAYPRELWDAGDVEPITIHGWVELPPGEYTLRAVFRNIASGRSGELSRAFEVPRQP